MTQTMTKKKQQKKSGKARGWRTAATSDINELYELSVQEPEAEVDLIDQVWEELRDQHASSIREDFCGTAALSCEWDKRRKSHQSWGIDLHAPTLAWGRRHRLAHLGDTAERVQLIEGDVLTAADQQ